MHTRSTRTRRAVVRAPSTIARTTEPAPERWYTRAELAQLVAQLDALDASEPAQLVALREGPRPGHTEIFPCEFPQNVVPIERKPSRRWVQLALDFGELRARVERQTAQLDALLVAVEVRS